MIKITFDPTVFAGEASEEIRQEAIALQRIEIIERQMPAMGGTVVVIGDESFAMALERKLWSNGHDVIFIDTGEDE